MRGWIKTESRLTHDWGMHICGYNTLICKPENTPRWNRGWRLLICMHATARGWHRQAMGTSGVAKLKPFSEKQNNSWFSRWLWQLQKHGQGMASKATRPAYMWRHLTSSETSWYDSAFSGRSDNMDKISFIGLCFHHRSGRSCLYASIHDSMVTASSVVVAMILVMQMSTSVSSGPSMRLGTIVQKRW